jgi:hypothetical protein
MLTFTVGPRPGFEVEYYLAWKHRHIASAWMYRLGRNPFAFLAYNRAFKLWSKTVERTHKFTVRSLQ